MVLIVCVGLGDFDHVEKTRRFINKNKYKLNWGYDKNNTLANSLAYRGASHECIFNKDGVLVHSIAGFNNDIAQIYVRNTISQIEKLK